MAERVNKELLRKLVEGEPQVISTSPADISISVPDETGGEKEYIYPDTTSSIVMAVSTSADLGVQLNPTYQERFIEGIEEVKTTRVEEVVVEAGIPKLPFVKFKIKLAPKKTIKRYTEQQKLNTDG